MAQTKRKKNISLCSMAILDTLSYSTIFRYPMSFYQLANFLITSEEIDYETLKTILSRLVRAKRVRVKNGRYYLPGVRCFSWNQGARNAKRLVRNVNYALKILSKIPWVQMIGITGSVAVYNAKKRDDVDILIVTSKNRLWITRLFTVLVLKILNVYRTDASPKGKICPNLFLDESKLSWDKKKRNLFIAHEILALTPVVDKNNIYLKLLSKNRWIGDYYANFSLFTGNIPDKRLRQSVLVDLYETFIRWAQLFYMRKKMTTEVAKKDLLHFNRDDCAPEILRKYNLARKKY